MHTSKKMKVYYNLHNHKWSIMDKETGLILGHADIVGMYGVTPKVSEAGRQRVLREKRKNVHAFMEGYLDRVLGFVPFRGRVLPEGVFTSCGTIMTDLLTELTYNPYKFDRFVVKSVPTLGVLGARYVWLTDTRQVFANTVETKRIEQQLELAV
jgi:hypothetical protein